MIRHFRKFGSPLVLVGTDGHLGQLIPLWIDAGVDGTLPMEIAAHNDPLHYRDKYPGKISFWGGIDKREIRSRERTYAEAMTKVPLLIEKGGYLPMLDHGVPPDVPLRSFLYMCDLITAIAEGRSVRGPEVRLPIEDKLGPIESMWSPDMIYDPEKREYIS